MVKQYITDESGDIQSVIINYKYYKEFESVFEDFLFGKILADSENEEEFSLEDTKAILGY
jgi:hypothetical protein